MASYILLILAFLAYGVWFILKILRIEKDWIAGLIGSALSLLVGIFFFAGKSTCDLGEIGSSYINLSYGFVLVALFAILAALLSILPFLSDWMGKKNMERAAKEQAEERKNA
ncbi:MAG TPA: hypothetical protein DCZ41_04270 [Firmicutes bacterium]|nr:hypothetical protein [Bacillota bacterium]